MATREREVRTRITGDPRGFNAAIKSAQGSLKGLGGDLTKVQSLAAKAFSFAGVGGALSAGGLVAMATSLASASRELTVLAQLSGTAVEDFQRLAYGARKVGIEQDKLADIFKDTQDKVGDFLETGGGALADFFENIAPLAGVTAAQFRNLSGPQALQLYVSSLEKANLSQSQMKFYLEAIASDSSRLIPLLRANGKGFADAADEVERLGGVLNEQAIARAAEFEQSLDQLRGRAKGVAMEIGVSLVPALNDLAQAYLAGVEADRQLGKSNGLATWADRGASAIAFVVDAMDLLLRGMRIFGIGLGASIAALSAATRHEFAAAKSIMSNMASDVEDILMEGQFSTRLREQQRQRRNGELGDAKQHGSALLKIEESLQTEITKLREMKAKQSKKDAEEELKGVERLKTALQAAWKASIDGAAEAREEAAKLLTQAADARQSGIDKATERRSRNLTPEQLSFASSQQAETARREANVAASGAMIAALHGDIKRAKLLAEEAAKQAERAEKLSENITNDEEAARLLEQIGVIREDALKAQAKIKQAEAKSLEEVAAQQNAQIQKAEERIAAIKAELEKPVTLKADIAAAESEVKRLQAELDKIKDKTVTVTINTVAANAGVNLPGAGGAAPGFARGGYTGHGGKFQPAGIVHAGEFVVRQEIVRQRGVMEFLAQLNAGEVHQLNLERLRGFADGGLVPNRATVSTDRTPIILQWPDGSSSRMSAEQSAAQQLQRVFRRAALARGRRS